MKRVLRASVRQEGDWFVAQCLEVDVASQGRTGSEALGNLGEALRLHLAPPAANVVPDITEIEVELPQPLP